MKGVNIIGIRHHSKDINMLQAAERTVYLKLLLLNSQNKVINSLEGNLVTDDFTIDADAAVRRNYNCTFYVSDESWQIGQDKNIWINKRIRPFVGYQSGNGEILWYQKGTFALNSPTLTYDETTHTIALSCLDLMCTLDGTLGGCISGDGIGGINRKIEANADIRESLIALLQDAGISKYNICSFNHAVPYDIKVDVGHTYKDMIDELLTLYAGYEYFFDINGVFTVQLIPQLQSDPVYLSHEIINPLVVSENRTQDWSTIRNYFEVYGENITPQFVADEVAGTVDGWTATLADVTSYENGDTYALKIPTTNAETVTININNLGEKVVFDDDGKQLEANKLTAGKYYCFRYRLNSDNMVYLGQYQAYGFYEETSPDCPFSTTNLGYKINGVLNDSKIYSDSLCEQRAKYEVYLASFMQDTISLSMIEIPFLTVNQKISYQPMDESEPIQYMTKRIQSNSADGLMSLDLVKFSEAYPNMEEVYQSMYERNPEHNNNNS